jgi:serine/threonine-protein kinase
MAIKQLWPNLSADVVARRRFAEEGRMLASLKHRHIVRVFDYVESDICALVLELMPGGSLGDRLRHSRVSVSAACTMVLGLLAGLEHAHQRGVVHRDIKPANLLFTEAGRLKVADFGVAKIIDGRREASAALTLDGRPVGTPAYMAPEQLNPALGSVSAATDVWASGTILVEVLTGRRPLEGVLSPAVPCATPTTAIAECLAEVSPTVTRALADVVAVATARLPAERYQSAAEFARQLRRACQASLES